MGKNVVQNIDRSLIRTELEFFLSKGIQMDRAFDLVEACNKKPVDLIFINTLRESYRDLYKRRK